MDRHTLRRLAQIQVAAEKAAVRAIIERPAIRAAAAARRGRA